MNKEVVPDVPTCTLYFLERNIGTKTLNILHQVWQRPDGTMYLREVGKLSARDAEARYGKMRNDYSAYQSGTLKA